MNIHQVVLHMRAKRAAQRRKVLGSNMLLARRSAGRLDQSRSVNYGWQSRASRNSYDIN